MINKKTDLDSAATTPKRKRPSIFVGHIDTTVTSTSLKLAPGFQTLMEKNYGKVGSSYEQVEQATETPTFGM